MHGFNNYEQEMEEFRQGRLHDLYNEFIQYLKNYPYPGWVRSGELELRFSITGPELRMLVKFGRRQSIPVASSGKGYRYARTSEELDTTLRHLRERRDSLSYTISRLEEACDVPYIEPVHDDVDEINKFYTNESV